MTWAAAGQWTATTQDRTPPVLTLVGGSVSIKLGQEYVEPGYSANDAIDGNITNRTIVTLPDFTTQGVKSVEYDSYDIAGNTTLASRQVTVGPANIRPTSDAGEDAQYRAGDVVQLSGSINDTDGDDLSFRWVTSSFITLSDPNILNPTFTVPLMLEGDEYIVCALISNDGFIDSIVSRATFYIPPDVEKPEIVLTPNQTSFTIVQGADFTPPTAIAIDDYDDDAAVNAVDLGGFNKDVVGIYRYTYDHTDESGKAADQVIVTVNVLEVTAGRFISIVDIIDKKRRWTEIKDPQDVDRYSISSKGWTLGDELSLVNFLPSEESGIIVSDVQIDNEIASAVFSGGNEGTHSIEVTMTSSSGRVIQRSVRLKVRQL